MYNVLKYKITNFNINIKYVKYKMKFSNYIKI